MRRKPRVPCPMPCGNEMIETHLTCDSCWKRIPAKTRKAAHAAYREARIWYRKFHDLDSVPDVDFDECVAAVRNHLRWNYRCLLTARRTFKMKGSKNENVVDPGQGRNRTTSTRERNS